jgi:hypothetical protein
VRNRDANLGAAGETTELQWPAVPVGDTLNRTLRQFGFELYPAPGGASGYGITGERTVRNALLRSLSRLGYGVRRTYDHDVPPELVAITERVRPYTMTSQRSVIGLCEAVRYLGRAGVGGAIVECGVWRGGSMMAVALTLLDAGIDDRDLYLFDTFAGMPEPGPRDISLVEPGQAARERWGASRQADHNAWAFASLDDVRDNVLGTGYPPERVHLVAGDVEATLPDAAPERISLLRLDTDWYTSTRHELEHLYPRLAPGGVLIIDDYGTWAGAREAVDEYPPARELYLARLDAFARIAVKPR